LRRNALFALLGFVVPTGVVFVAFRILVRSLGADAFGVYVLATSISGSLAFLDFGSTSAGTKFISQHLGNGQPAQAADVLVASFVFNALVGAIGAAVMWVFAARLVGLFSVPPELRGPAVFVFRIAAIQFVTFALTSVFLSCFKALHRFDIATATVSTLSVISYGTAIIAIKFFGAGLIGVTAVSLAGNALILCMAGAIVWMLCRRAGMDVTRARPSLPVYRSIFSFGAIMTVNTLAGMVLYQAQRYVAGRLLGTAAVAIYVLSFTVASKAHALVNAASEIMFPFASATTNRDELRRVYFRLLIGSAAIALCVTVPLMIAPLALLRLWLDPVTAAKAAPLLRPHAIGFLFLALSPAAFHLVNGIGRPSFNTAFAVLNAVLNLTFIAVFSRGEVTLVQLAYAFALANIANAVLFQAAVELIVWRKWILPPSTLVPAT
jgi:O-antigen/teichoic acid export membrane protein